MVKQCLACEREIEKPYYWLFCDKKCFDFAVKAQKTHGVLEERAI